MYYFYILRCSDNTLYCGQTTNLGRRVEEHNSGSVKGAKYTRGRTPAVLVYFETYTSLQEALRREREVKKWKKDKKESLIQ